MSVFHDMSTATAVKQAQRAVKNVLYTYIETRYQASISKGLDLDSVIGQRNEVFAWWIPVLVVVNVLIVAGLMWWEYRQNKDVINAFFCKSIQAQ